MVRAAAARLLAISTLYQREENDLTHFAGLSMCCQLTIRTHELMSYFEKFKENLMKTDLIMKENVKRKV